MITILDEHSIWTADKQRKYQLYIEMRKQREKFLKDLKEQRYGDWIIEKKLIEAGGLGKTVYILPARGGGSTPSYRTLKKYYEEGRDVQFVTLRKYDWPRLSDKDIETIRNSIHEFELYSKLVKPWREPKYSELFKDFYPEAPGYNNIWIRSTNPDAFVLDYSKLCKKTYLGIWEDGMDKQECQECTRRCAQFMCCMCEHRSACKCAKIDPPDEED